MAAIAPTAADAIERAGGWLFDQALAGWDVTVITAEPADCRPLRILGVRDYPLESVQSYQGDGSCLSAIAVCGALFARDERARRMVLASVEAGVPELRFWGDTDDTDDMGDMGDTDDTTRTTWATWATRATRVATSPGPTSAGAASWPTS